MTITRLWRDELEFVPHAKTTLEFGDEVRVVGDEADLKRLAPVLGHHSERLSETPFLSLGLGLLAGVLVGAVPLGLPGRILVQTRHGGRAPARRACGRSLRPHRQVQLPHAPGGPEVRQRLRAAAVLERRGGWRPGRPS